MLHLVLTLLLACSGGDADGVSAGPVDAPVRPDISCPEGTALETGQSAKGSEQWCARDGVMNGPYIRFHPNGIRAAKGAHLNNQQDGDWIWWHDNKKEAYKGKYVRGKPTGAWTWWYPNGNRQEEGDYLQGRKAGQWVSWFESGAKKDEGIYHNGMKDGQWLYYEDDAENSLSKTERWENGVMVEEHGPGVGKPVPGSTAEPAPPPAPVPVPPN